MLNPKNNNKNEKIIHFLNAKQFNITVVASTAKF
jgi:hypothetical protein